MLKRIGLFLLVIATSQYGFSQSKYKDSIFTTLDFKVPADSVYKLSLKDQGLRSFPVKILECKNLEYLNLGYNKIREIPNSISQLSKLKYISVAANPISKIPSGVYQLAELNTLQLADTKVGELSDELGKLSKLEILDMTLCPIRKLPASFVELSELKMASFVYDTFKGTLISAEDQIEIKKRMPKTRIFFYTE
jgi:Leucine-rich repeat (LRR) protein